METGLPLFNNKSPAASNESVAVCADFPHQPIAGSLLLLQTVSSRKCGKIISCEFEWAFHNVFFAAEVPCILISYIFWL
jgi:hypothetical protein